MEPAQSKPKRAGSAARYDRRAMTNATGLVELIQLSISPVILISGVGMLLLTLTNRFSRVVDRVRGVHRESLRSSDPTDVELLRKELEVLYRRSRIVRLSIQLAGASILMTALLILVLFSGAIAGRASVAVAAVLFLLAVGLLVGSIVAFLRDIRLSLEALDVELGRGN